MDFLKQEVAPVLGAHLTIASIEPEQGSDRFKVHFAASMSKKELKELITTANNHDIAVVFEIGGK